MRLAISGRRAGLSWLAADDSSRRDLKTAAWLLAAAMMFVAGCQGAPPATPTVTLRATALPANVATSSPSPVVPPTLAQAISDPTLTAKAPMATPTAPPTATPHPLAAFTIPGLRQRDFPGGPVTVRALLAQNEAYSQTYIEYPSDGLIITGLQYTPTGEGPFPVLILLHGYIDRDRYSAGADTWQAADYFARRGYLVLAPDLRSWGESDAGLSLFHMGLVADVLNLIGSLDDMPEADSSRLGLWGHSMGGGLATKVLAINDSAGAAVLYAPNSADDADLIARWGPGCLEGQSEAAGDHCNPAEVIPPGTPPELIDAYAEAAADPQFLRRVAPLYHLDNVAAPLQIHIGTADGQALVETPTDWSVKLNDALIAAGKEVAFYTYEGQGHDFSGESWSTLLERAGAFFDEQLKQKPSTDWASKSQNQRLACFVRKALACHR